MAARKSGFTYATNSSHAENTKHLSFGVTAERGLTVPFPCLCQYIIGSSCIGALHTLTDGSQWHVSLSQSTDHEENTDICGGIVDSDWCARDGDPYRSD
jgi:hypothetical protein